MATKVRVYELARELGLENADIIELCNALGIGVKSHSSSIVEPQADRLRRKAKREGLAKEPVAEAEAVPAKPVSKRPPLSSRKPLSSRTPVSSKPSVPPKSVPEPAEPKQEVQPEPKVPAPPTDKSATVVSSKPAVPIPPPPTTPKPVAAPETPKPVVKPEAPAPVAETPSPESLEAPLVDAAPSEAELASRSESAPSPQPKEPTPDSPKLSDSSKLVETSTVDESSPADDSSATREQESTKSVDAAESAKADSTKAATASSEHPKPPRGMSGKAIPPPPGPPVGRNGKPIPPPPGGGKSAPAPGRSTGRPGGGPNRGNFRPGGGPTTGPRPGSAPSGGRPGGAPPGRGGPPGRGNGRGGPNRPRPRRKTRRRRNREELTPMDVPTYTAEGAAIPEGTVVIERASTAQDLAEKLNRTAADVVRFLLTNGEMVTATQSLSDELINMFAEELGAEIRLVNPGEEQEVELRKVLEFEDEEDEELMATWPHRSPVITIMGHVDHGKTLLLDRIRSTNVVEGEAGGITQHIGAYQVNKNGATLTFIDTPGHAAFTAMRARGAEATDIVVLVVAADDGVMPQTVEALDHAKAAEVPIIVAVNKMDREGADPDKVMSQLAERELVPEQWGGDTMFVELSAMTGDGIDDLLENLALIAEVEDLRATAEGRAAGAVLEAHLDTGRGPVATVLVERGTLHVGDPLVTGAAWGRVRALINDKGENVKSAGPSTPVQVLGLNDVAVAGDGFVVAPSEKLANKVAETREHWRRLSSLGRDASATSGGARLEDIFQQIQAGESATLNLIVKADVNGSLEAVTDSLRKLERDEVKLAFQLRGVGGITENDVQLAAASNATILGFNVRPDRKARKLAETENVEIRNYEIIYKLLEDIENAMLGLLAPEFEEIITGEAEVREIFRVPKLGSIAGCMVR